MDNSNKKANELVMLSIIEILTKNIRKNTPLKENDYIGEKQLIICGICHTPKETMRTLTIAGKTRELKMPIACECETLQFEREQQELKRSKIEDLRKRFIPDSTYRGYRFEYDDSSNTRNSVLARKYVEKWETILKNNTGLLFTGMVGTGKSFYACCIANAVIDKGYGAIVTTIANIKAKLSDFSNKDRDDLLYDIMEIPLLVLDDFGTESMTDTSREYTHTIIDTRYKSGKPVIITTNLTMEQIQEPKTVSPRIADRILEMCPAQVNFAGESKRRNIAERNRQETYKLLTE